MAPETNNDNGLGYPRCAHCLINYSPSIYQVGYTTETEHFHPGLAGKYGQFRDGGLISFDGGYNSFDGVFDKIRHRAIGYVGRGFLASVVLGGEIVNLSDDIYPFEPVPVKALLSRNVRVEKIIPFTGPLDSEDPQLTEGILVAENSGELIPCSYAEGVSKLTDTKYIFNVPKKGFFTRFRFQHDNAGLPLISYHFKAEDGEVHFRPFIY